MAKNKKSESKLSKSLKSVNMKKLVFIIAFGIIGLVALRFSSAATSNIDLKAYYPNPLAYEKLYLEGFNYISGSPVRSVFWFEKLDQWSFKAYNAAPENPDAECNWDLLSWWDDGYLRYSQTHHECPGSIPNDTYYDSPIVFLPRYWNPDDGLWSLDGTSGVKYYENGELRCTGTNKWKAEILGWDEIAPGEQAIRWRSTQTTTWETGDVPGKCYAGYTTNWQENNWLSEIPQLNGNKKTKALKRSYGGNLDTQSGNWDVWYDRWEKLNRNNYILQK